MSSLLCTETDVFKCNSFFVCKCSTEMVVVFLTAVLSLPLPFTSCKLYNLPRTCCPAQFNLMGVLCQFLNIPLLRDSLNCTPVVMCHQRSNGDSKAHQFLGLVGISKTSIIPELSLPWM